MKKMNAYERIQKAMKNNEMEVLMHIRRLNKNLMGYRPMGALGSWYGALERLEKSGRIFWRKSHTNRSYGMSGYWIRTKTRTK